MWIRVVPSPRETPEIHSNPSVRISASMSRGKVFFTQPYHSLWSLGVRVVCHGNLTCSQDEKDGAHEEQARCKHYLPRYQNSDLTQVAGATERRLSCRD